ncbi:Neuronal acetylcholine receptor subunit alpha-3 [Cichlidogyrus casuarinus]|uniref:Neuronal acetylcholine receptor subunit alpha-3 n=1 Tax=Cichlidogyrus casuarinus TaxID=1844966 RepID=A0ABD2PWL8_9PLAT
MARLLCMQPRAIKQNNSDQNDPRFTLATAEGGKVKNGWTGTKAKKASFDDEFVARAPDPRGAATYDLEPNFNMENYEELGFIDDPLRIFVHNNSRLEPKEKKIPVGVLNQMLAQNPGSFLRNDLGQIKQLLRCITEKLRHKEIYAHRAAEWKFAARVIDRFCLILFFNITIISSFVILVVPRFNTPEKSE